MRAGLCRMRDVARGAFSLSSTYFSPIPTYPPTHLLTYSPTLGSVSEYQGRTDDLKQAFATVAGDHTTASNTCTCSLRCGCPCRLSPPADVPVLESRTRVVSWHAHLPRSPATLAHLPRSPATLAHLPRSLTCHSPRLQASTRPPSKSRSLPLACVSQPPSPCPARPPPQP